jgi:hypothetical protein
MTCSKGRSHRSRRSTATAVPRSASLANPYRYLEVRGRARIGLDDDYRFARTVRAKYGADLNEHDQPGDHRVVVTLEPVSVHAVVMDA